MITAKDFILTACGTLLEIHCCLSLEAFGFRAWRGIRVDYTV